MTLRRKVCGKQACIYDPPLHCLGELLTDRHGLVGKVHKSRAVRDQEVAAVSTVRDINANSRFTITPVSSCRPRLVGPEDTLQFFMPRADATLRQDVADLGLPNGPHMIAMLANVMDGLASFAAHGMAYQDMSPDNIMRKGSVYVLIDFSNILPLTDVLTRRNRFLTATWAYNAPEQKLVGGRTFADAMKNYAGFEHLLGPIRQKDLCDAWARGGSQSLRAHASATADVFAFGILLLWMAQQQPPASEVHHRLVALGRFMAVLDARHRPTCEMCSAKMREPVRSQQVKPMSFTDVPRGLPRRPGRSTRPLGS